MWVSYRGKKDFNQDNNSREKERARKRKREDEKGMWGTGGRRRVAWEKKGPLDGMSIGRWESTPK